MEEKDPKKSQSYRPVKEPSKEVKEYYENYFRRNQNKFMRRSKLEESHLGSEFDYDDKRFKLLGAVDPNLMFVLDINENRYYFLHSDIVTDKILNQD
jgi:hypothetical protein